MPEYKIKNLEEVNKALGIKLDDIFKSDLKEGKILYFEDATTIEGDFSLISHKMPEEAIGYVVAGDLTVKGKILDGDMDYGPFLFVKGNLEADIIATSGADLYINNDAKIKKYIYTYYNHGSLHIDGNLTTKLLIINDHFTTVTGKINAIVTGDSENMVNENNCILVDLKDILDKSVLSGDSDERYLEDDKFMKKVAANTSFLKSEYVKLFDDNIAIKDFFKGPEERIVKLIEKEILKASSKNKALTSLNLSNKKISRLPAYLFSLKTITKLNLSANAISEVPQEISALINLEDLNISGCKFNKLPKEFCLLENLKKLDVCRSSMVQYNGRLTLPDNIGKLKNLEYLNSNYNLCFPIPDSFKQLINLKELELYQCSNEKEIDFPEIITELPKLKVLNIGSNSFKQIPESIAKLINLQVLYLQSSLCYIKTLPDLSPLKSLIKLDAAGSKSFTARPDPTPEIIKSFFDIPNLKELDISRYGAYKVELKHFNGLSNLKKVTTLDISFNELTRLPEEIFTLKTLELLKSDYNPIPKKDIIKLKELIPNVRIEGI